MPKPKKVLIKGKWRRPSPRSTEQQLAKFSEKYHKWFTSDYFDEEVIDSFEIYFFLISINEETGKFTKLISNLEGGKLLAVKFFKENSRSIEIVFKGILQKVYFVVHPACWYLAERSKEQFMFEVQRFSVHQKLKDYVKATFKMIDDMEFQIKQKANRNVLLDTFKFSHLRILSFLIALMINIGIFLGFSKEVENSVSFTSEDFDESHPYFKVMGTAHVLMCILLIFSWFRQARPLVIMDAWREYCRQIKRNFKTKKSSLSPKDLELALSILDKNIID